MVPGQHPLSAFGRRKGRSEWFSTQARRRTRNTQSTATSAHHSWADQLGSHLQAFYVCIDALVEFIESDLQRKNNMCLRPGMSASNVLHNTIHRVGNQGLSFETLTATIIQSQKIQSFFFFFYSNVIQALSFKRAGRARIRRSSLPMVLYRHRHCQHNHQHHH